MSPRRRVVAVVFVDLTGYTALCESLDAEQVHLLVRPLMNALRRACVEHRGHVPSIEGDGFMAVFGALHGSEDAPLRALAASVRMQRLVAERRRAYGPALPDLRIGVNLGEVLVAPSWESGGFSVTGDAINVGSRLCTAAGPGDVLVASALLSVVPRSLRFDDEQRIEVRGRELPVHARLLQWADGSVLPDSRRAPSATAFVGRDDLIGLLDQHDGTALLVGEPGVGKTRAAREWTAGSGRDVLTAGCPSFRAGDEAALAVELARGLPGGWLDRHPPILLRRLRSLRGEVVDSLEDDTLQDQLAALRTVLVARAALAPVVVHADDLHWASAVELALVNDLLGVPGLSVLSTARPDRVPVMDCPRLDLHPLDDTSSAALVAGLLPGADAQLTGFLTSRAGGVPLFIEQCAQLLLEERTVELTAGGAVVREPARLRRVPTVMRLFVTGRLELLTTQEREVLDNAAVTGDAVEPELLRHLCRADVSEVVEGLVERGLLRWEPGPHDVRLRFRHALVRDVAYEGMTRSRRVEQHRAAADWFSVRLPHGAMAARAAHLETALALSEGRGQPDCSLATDTLMALLTHAHAMVQERPQDALAVVLRAENVMTGYATCKLDRLDLDLVLAEVLAVLGHDERSAGAARNARNAAEAAGDRAGTAKALWLEATALKLMRPGEALELFDRAGVLYAELNDSLGSARVACQRAFVGEGDSPSRIPAAYAQAYEVARVAGDARMAATSAQLVAFHALLQGRPYLERWRMNAEAVARPEDEAGRCRLLIGQSMVDLESLELTSALRSALEALRLAEEIGVSHVANNATWTACDAAALLGDLELADDLLAGSWRIATSRPTDHQRSDTLVSEVLLRSRQGRFNDATTALAEAERIGRELGVAYSRTATASRAQLAADTGHFAAVPALVDQVTAVDVQIEQTFLSLRPRLLRLQCLVASRSRVSFAESESLRREARERGAPAIESIAVRWLELADLLKGERPLIDLQLPPLPDLSEARAVDHALHALLDDDPDRLLRAAAEWRTLGTTVWPAVPLVWHAALTGDATHLDEARDLLRAVGAPSDLEADLRALVARP